MGERPARRQRARSSANRPASRSIRTRATSTSPPATAKTPTWSSTAPSNPSPRWRYLCRAEVAGVAQRRPRLAAATSAGAAWAEPPRRRPRRSSSGAGSGSASTASSPLAPCPATAWRRSGSRSTPRSPPPAPRRRRSCARIAIAINRNGRFDTTGLPVCRLEDIQPSTTANALAACRGALVGEGHFSANVKLPEQSPFPSAGKVLAFNGRLHGKPAILAHIYGTQPAPTSTVLPFLINDSPRHLRHGPRSLASPGDRQTGAT